MTSCVAGLPDLRTELPQVKNHLMTAHLELARRRRPRRLPARYRQAPRHAVLEGASRRGPSTPRQQLLPPWRGLGRRSERRSTRGLRRRRDRRRVSHFSFQGNVLAFLQGRGRTAAFDRYLQSRERVRDSYLLSHFLSSHDVPGALHTLDGDRDLHFGWLPSSSSPPPACRWCITVKRSGAPEETGRTTAATCRGEIADSPRHRTATRRDPPGRLPTSDRDSSRASGPVARTSRTDAKRWRPSCVRTPR